MSIMDHPTPWAVLATSLLSWVVVFLWLFYQRRGKWQPRRGSR